MPVTVTLGPLVCIDEGDGLGISAPFAWPVFFKVDNEAVTEILGGDAAVEPWLIAPGGAHGNLPEMDAGDSTPFVATATFENVIPIPLIEDATIVGFVVALLEEDVVPSDEEIVVYYGEFVERVHETLVGVVRSRIDEALPHEGGVGTGRARALLTDEARAAVLLSGSAPSPATDMSARVREELRAALESGLWTRLGDVIGPLAPLVRPFLDRDDVIGGWADMFQVSGLTPPAIGESKGPREMRRRSENGTFSIEAQAGALTSGPSIASWEPGRLDFFARGDEDNTLWHASHIATGEWRPFTQLDGTLFSDPAAVSWGPGRIDVFVRGTDAALWHKFLAGDTWSGWESLGGVLTSRPAAASWEAESIDVFARGTDNALWHKFFDHDHWSEWASVGGVLTSGPGAVSWDGDRVDVFVRGADNALHQRTMHRLSTTRRSRSGRLMRSRHRWTDWHRLGGNLFSGPAVASWEPGRLDVFVRGHDSGLWHLWYEGAWAPDWQPLGGVITSDPAAVAWGPGRLDMCAAFDDRRLYHMWYDSGFSDWEQQPRGVQVHP